MSDAERMYGQECEAEGHLYFGDWPHDPKRDDPALGRCRCGKVKYATSGRPLRFFTEVEATRVERPDGPEPWVWPDPIQAMVSDSYDLIPTGRAADGSPLAHAVAVRLLSNLYHAGYAVVAEPGYRRVAATQQAREEG